jgi:hypothetical protein
MPLVRPEITPPIAGLQAQEHPFSHPGTSRSVTIAIASVPANWDYPGTLFWGACYGTSRRLRRLAQSAPSGQSVRVVGSTSATTPDSEAHMDSRLMACPRPHFGDGAVAVSAAVSRSFSLM